MRVMKGNQSDDSLFAARIYAFQNSISLAGSKNRQPPSGRIVELSVYWRARRRVRNGAKFKYTILYKTNNITPLSYHC